MGRLTWHFMLAITLSINSSCDKNVNETLIDYVIFNESGFDLSIVTSDDSNFRNTKESFSIKNNEAFSEGFLRNERFDNDTTFATFLGTENVRIVFGTERTIVYSCIDGNAVNCNDPRNILKFSADENNIAEYTFTTEDFENAMPCDGSCM